MAAEPLAKRAIDTVLKWALGLVGAGIIATIGLLIDIRVSLAVYQADNKAMKEQITKLENWQNSHDQEDRARFRELAERR